MKLEKIVPEYHSGNIIVKKLFFNRLKSAIKLADEKLKRGNKNVIDLGCGEGLLLRILENNYKDVKTFGLDVEPNIEKLKGVLKAELKVADLCQSSFPKDFFDIIFILDVLEHFKDLERPVKEIKKILKEDGLLIVSMPTENVFYKINRFIIKKTFSEKTGPCSSSHYHNAGQIEVFLSRKGFRAIKKIYLPLPPPFSLFHIVSFSKILP